MRVGLPGVCRAESHSEVSNPPHDLHKITAPAAMLTYEKADGATVHPALVWKSGQASVRQLWTTHLGTGETGLVQYVVATEAEAEDEFPVYTMDGQPAKNHEHSFRGPLFLRERGPLRPAPGRSVYILFAFIIILIIGGAGRSSHT